MHYTRSFTSFAISSYPGPVGDLPAFEEYRTDLKGNPLDASSLGDLFMITSDFTSTWLYLSPADQHDSHFRYFGIQTIRNRECHVVGFAQDPERARSVGGFSTSRARASSCWSKDWRGSTPKPSRSCGS